MRQLLPSDSRREHSEKMRPLCCRVNASRVFADFIRREFVFIAAFCAVRISAQREKAVSRVVSMKVFSSIQRTFRFRSITKISPIR